jgi:hypothetical protein
MIRLSIRRKIMGIAVALIVLMAITAILSMVWVMQVGDHLQEVTNSYIPAYGNLARANIRSLERALALRPLRHFSHHRSKRLFNCSHSRPNALQSPRRRAWSALDSASRASDVGACCASPISAGAEGCSPNTTRRASGSVGSIARWLPSLTMTRFSCGMFVPSATRNTGST